MYKENKKSNSVKTIPVDCDLRGEALVKMIKRFKVL